MCVFGYLQICRLEIDKKYVYRISGTPLSSAKTGVQSEQQGVKIQHLREPQFIFQ
jgi:hypothetical protein